MFIEIDMKEFERFARALGRKTMHKAVFSAHAYTLNDFTYDAYRASQNILRKRLTIRNKTLVSWGTGYQKTKVNLPIDSQVTHIETYQKARFSGWIEQRHGSEDHRKRKWTEEGRTGSRYSGKVRGKLRFKPGRVIPKFNPNAGHYGKNDQEKLAFYTNWLNQKRRVRRGKGFKWVGPAKFAGEPFIIENTSHVQDGVYTMNRKGKLVFVAFTKKRNRVKKVDFQNEAVAEVIKRNSAQRNFGRHFDKQIILEFQRRGILVK